MNPDVSCMENHWIQLLDISRKKHILRKGITLDVINQVTNMLVVHLFLLPTSPAKRTS